MRGAILSIAAAAMLSACATTTPPSTAAALAAPQIDYSHLSCRQLAAELAVTVKAMSSAARRERPAGEGQTAQAYLFPASLGAAAPAQASQDLQSRLEGLKRASRAKRCNSAWSQDVATA